MKQTIGQYLMIVLMVAGAYMIGVYKTKTEYLEKAATTPTQQAATAEEERVRPEITREMVEALWDKDAITFGDKSSKLIIAEFSDPSCPYCHVAGGKNPELNKEINPSFQLVTDGGTYTPIVPEIKKLVDEKKAAFVWVYANGHGNGEMGTKALYCAYEAGKFWEVHDLLMSNKGYDLLNTTVKNDKAKAKELSQFLAGAMDASKMEACLAGGKYDGRIAADTAKGTPFGGFGTPTFLANTTLMEGAEPYTQTMKGVVESVLQ